MAVEAKKKRKLFQVAKELNLGKETIREFLEKKGVPVTGVNMRIDEETYELILTRFSREKKMADKIHKRREEKTREEEEKKPVVEEITPAEPEVAEPAIEEVQPETAEKTPEAETAEEEAPPAPAEETEPAAEAPAETPEPEAEPEAEPETPAETPAEAPPASEEAEVPEAEAETAAPQEVSTPASETAATEAPASTEEEETEKSEEPQVGDIVYHPMAEQYLERMRQMELAKKERQRKTLERLKKGPAADKKAAAAGNGAAVETPADDTDQDSIEKRRRKKEKKRAERDIQEEKDARRRKAFEMLRKERKNLRPDMITPEEETSEEAPATKDGRRKRRKKQRKEVDQQEVDTTLKKTLAEIRDSGTGKKRRKRVKAAEGEEESEQLVIQVTEFMTTQDLANLLDVPVNEVIRKCLELGLVVTINQRLDMDTIKLLAEEFGAEVQEEEEFASDFLEEAQEEPDRPEDLEPRPPVVTIMGHVDHGKTSLLDYIRHTNVVAGESGGITQHIGAYEVVMEDGRKITFLDTPGHEAFTAMRARGAQVTDIVVLVIAADDRVMPQTEEAIDHAKAAGVSIVIAINKVDKPGANPEAIKKQLADRNILVEDWGGQYQCVEVSAKTGQNVPELLEKILLEAELLDLKANPNKRARGVVLEAQLDKGKGPVATILVQQGTLRVGQAFVIGQHYGRVRAMLNERGQRVEEAGPSTPVQILGIDGVPEAGDRFLVLEDEREARMIAQRRQQLKREQDFRQVRLLTLDELSKQIKAGDVKELKLLVKADVDGSAQALTDALQKLSTDEVEVQVIRRAVGPISESDVILAAASQAIIIGFHVRPSQAAKELAEKENVDIRLYKVIYDAIEDVEKALEGMLEPIEREVVLGTAEVRETFKISRVGTIAGCYVTSGKINRNANVRVVRNDVEIYDGKLASLKRFKDDVREVSSGFECGLSIANFNDIKVGDIIEAYEIVMEAQTLR